MRQKIDNITHEDATRKNIPTAELQSIMQKGDLTPVQVAYMRRNADLDPQLVWRGKDLVNSSDLVSYAPPLYIQEKVHPKVLIDSLARYSNKDIGEQVDLFDDFNGLPDEDAKTEFYKHEGHWTNRMILGDGLQVMVSLAERESLRGKVQSIFIDPPYGIKFNSNFQWSTTSLDVKDGKMDHITREPEQVKAFRDTWRDGIHSYLSYLRDRVTVARDLLHDTGSIFVQIGDENVHLVRSLLDEIFGRDSFVSQISFVKAGALGATGLPRRLDYVLWYSKNQGSYKYRKFLIEKDVSERGAYNRIVNDDYSLRPLSKDEKQDPKLIDVTKLCRTVSFTKPGPGARYPLKFRGSEYHPGRRWWGFPEESAQKVIRAGRLVQTGKSVESLRYWNDYAAQEISNLWTDTGSGSGMKKVYVVQTNVEVIKRCILMSTDPGDLVLDPTCGSGTTAYVAEQWGRRWITIDTSRVALALARSRIMGAKFPYYLLSDSEEGAKKESELSMQDFQPRKTFRNIMHGFVYKRVPRITLKAITQNHEIDNICDKFEPLIKARLDSFNKLNKSKLNEWELPSEASCDWSSKSVEEYKELKKLQIQKQNQIDNAINARASFEHLYDQPYEDNSRVRVSGPFTVESISPHKSLPLDENDEIINSKTNGITNGEQDFVSIIMENIKSAGVQQVAKNDKIEFESIAPWPGEFICADGVYYEGDKRKRAAILIGPEFGTLSRPDLVSAAREAAEADFDALITFAFNYDAHSSEFSRLGRIPVLKARMNADLHMADDLKNTGKGNLFVIFGEPDIDIIDLGETLKVKVNGVDIFDPSSGEVRSDSVDGIACWFIDTNYNEESFFVRHAYFIGANDPYDALKKTLRNEINEEAWESVNSDISQEFYKPTTGRIAVKVINHLGDEVMKVYKVD
ncbi:MAG: site-specific DNA-methyltransferase [Halobacteriovorax sp.]|nr:site-specific DNA-methyltransferase [Halobacteriovorax sp.]